MRLAIALFMVSAQLFGATTYYVSTVGNDSTGNGSVGNPWLTVGHAVTVATTGDTVLVQPGVYNERPNLNVAGITFRANGAVTNQGTYQVNANNVVVDGFEFTAQGTLAGEGSGNGLYIGTNFTGVSIINNKFHDCPGGIDAAIRSRPLTALGIVGLSSSCTISNNFIYDWGTANNAAIVVDGGTGWLVVNNLISNVFGADIFRVWGGNHVIRGNTILRHGFYYGQIVGAGNAAFNGRYYWSKYYFTNWGLSLPVFTNAAGYLLANGSDAFASHGFTNKWNLVNGDRSITYASAPEVKGTWTMNNATIVSAPTGGAACGDHPDLIQTWGPYENGTNLTYYSLQLCTNLLFENNWIEGDFLGTAGQMNSSSGTNLPHSVQDVTFRNNVFIGLSGASIDVYNIKYHNNTFYDCGRSAGDPYTGSSVIAMGWYDPSNSTPRGECFGCEITNNAFIACGVGSTSQGWYSGQLGNTSPYTVDLVSNFYTRCDFNYVVNDTNSWAQKSVSPGWGSNAFKFYEPHGVNGGDPKIAGMPIDFRLKTGSPLVDVGAAIETNDFDNFTRPMGAAVDIGAFEYDSNLLVRLNFALGTTASVPDATGNSHDGLQMDATNRIYFTNFSKGVAGVFYDNGIMTNDPPKVYNKSQYLAITNITGGLSNIVNGTICFWVYWNTNYIGAQPEPERGAIIMDAGDLVNFAGQPSHTTNSWVFEYGPPPLALTPSQLIFRRWPTNDYTDTNTMLAVWTNQTRLQNNWWHVAVTWSANTAFTAYENGTISSTNTFPHPYLEVGGANPGWICVGALQHSGTPQWADDAYPNAGFLMGQLADVRIYNRVLSTNEVFALFNSSEAVSGGSGPAPAQRTFSAGTIRAGRVSKP